MVLEADYEQSSAPKLALFSLPRIAQEPPGMLTPPSRTTVSVPFQWEEAPGKPRPCTTETKPSSARCLELPPRLLREAQVTNMSSPMTVLDGPYVGRSLPRSLSSGKGESFRSPENSAGKKVDKERALFGSTSSRWGSNPKKYREFGGGSFHFSHPTPGGSSGGHGDYTGGTRVKITRVTRKGSFSALSRSTFWTTIYEGFKQVAPWKNRQEKMRKMSSTNVATV